MRQDKQVGVYLEASDNKLREQSEAPDSIQTLWPAFFFHQESWLLLSRKGVCPKMMGPQIIVLSISVLTECTTYLAASGKLYLGSLLIPSPNTPWECSFCLSLPLTTYMPSLICRTWTQLSADMQVPRKQSISFCLV